MSSDEVKVKGGRENPFMRNPFLLIIILFVLLFVLPLGMRPLIIPDETRYAEIPREMIASGDWAVPRLNGLKYFEKPAMGYWMVAASISLFGENAFAVRFPSAMATGISALMLFFLIRPFVRRDWSRLVALSAFLTFAEVYWVGTFNILDGGFSMFVTGSIVCFFLAYMAPERRKRTGFLAACGVFCGLAFLVKGFSAFVIPVAAAAPFAIWERRFQWALRSSWVPALAALAVCLPWAVTIHVREPDFWRFFFWNEHIRRFLTQDAQHSARLWFYFLVFPGGALPWTFLFPSAVSGLWRGGSKDPLIRFCLCWLVFPFLFFSASSGKLPTYILPCFAPAAILLAMGMENYLDQGRKRLFNAGALTLACLTAIGAFLLLLIPLLGYEKLESYDRPLKLGVAAAGLIIWMVLVLCSRGALEGKKKAVLFAAAPIVFLFLSNFLLPDHTLQHKAPGSFLVDHSARIHPDTILVSDEDLVHAVAWFYHRSDIYIAGSDGELSYGLGFSKHRWLKRKDLKGLVAKSGGSGRVVVIVTPKTYLYYRQDLPNPLFESRNGRDGLVFAQF